MVLIEAKRQAAWDALCAANLAYREHLYSHLDNPNATVPDLSVADELKRLKRARHSARRRFNRWDTLTDLFPFARRR